MPARRKLRDFFPRAFFQFDSLIAREYASLRKALVDRSITLGASLIGADSGNGSHLKRFCQKLSPADGCPTTVRGP